MTSTSTAPRDRGERQRVSFEGRVLFVGVDLAKRSWKVTVRTVELVLRSLSITPDPQVLGDWLQREYRGAHILVGYEAGCFGYAAHDALSAFGFDVRVIAPHTLPRDLVKTDRLDSGKLARLLAGGLFKGIWIPTLQQRQDRAVIRRREQLLRDQVRLQNRIKKLLLFHGIPLATTDRSPHWTSSYIRSLAAVEFAEPLLTSTLQSMVEEFVALRLRIRQQLRWIQQLAEMERYSSVVRLLRSIPGVGVLTAMTLATELQNVARFPSGEALASYLGLTPRQYSTADADRKGHLTHAGNAFVRRALVELAWRTIRRDPALLAKFDRVRRRRGTKIGIIAVARKLAVRIRRLLLDQAPYQLGVAA